MTSVRKFLDLSCSAPSSVSFAARRLAPWLVPLLILVGWELAADTGLIAQRVLPAPTSVGAAFWRSLEDGSLPRAVAISSERAFEGLLVGGLLGFAFGVINGLWRPAELLLDSTLQMLRNIPHLAIIPMVILWFGIGEEAKIFLVAIGVLFPVYLNTYHGVRAIDPALIEMARVYDIGRWGLLWRVILPGALPSVFVGLRYGLGIMWLTLIVAETISASSGIGYMTMNAREFLQTDVVLLGVIVYATLGKISDTVAKRGERALLSWHPIHTRRSEKRV
jgi:sulfonate transport system permease protein